MAARLSVIIPSLNAGEVLPATLDALLAGVSAGVLRELVISDGGSVDATLELAEAAGAIIVTGPPGRGGQLKRGAAQAEAEWLLFLHSDTVLSDDWIGAVCTHMNSHPNRAAVFRLAFDVQGVMPRLVAGGANLRTKIFGLPYGDQGLLISRALYDQIGGFADMALMEDVAIARALQGHIRVLECTATTSAARYVQDGWILRPIRNLWTLARYLCGADPAALSRHYHKE